MTHDDAVTWTGAIARYTTMADGGARVYLDIPDDVAAEIAGDIHRLRGRAVRIVIVADIAPVYGLRDID